MEYVRDTIVHKKVIVLKIEIEHDAYLAVFTVLYPNRGGSVAGAYICWTSEVFQTQLGKSDTSAPG